VLQRRNEAAGWAFMGCDTKRAEKPTLMNLLEAEALYYLSVMGAEAFLVVIWNAEQV
jgi:hypothetical protein